MSAPAPPTSPALIATHCDDLVVTAVRRLEAKSADGSWGLLKTVLLGVPSFGLLPMLAWSRLFREFANDDAETARDLAEWARLRGRRPAAVRPLLAAAAETEPNPLPRVMALVLATLIVGVFVIQFLYIPFSIENLIRATYQHEFHPYESSPFERPEFLYRVWVAGLSIGYAAQWLQVRTHVQDVKCFIQRLNPVIEAEMLPSVRIVSRGWVYFRPLWILMAVILSMYGAWWGIPMALAGMAQRRYTTLTGRRLRKELARRMRDVAMNDRARGICRNWNGNAMRQFSLPGFVALEGAILSAVRVDVNRDAECMMRRLYAILLPPGREQSIIRQLDWLLAAKRLRRMRARHTRDATLTGVSRGFAAVASARRCENARCLAPVRSRARFCPRCGSMLT